MSTTPFSYRIELPDPENAEAEIRSYLSRWLEVPALREIVEAHGGKWPVEGSLKQRLDELNEFSQAWDFRGGAERLDINDQTQVNEDLIMSQAADLSMTVPVSPSASSYDHGLILGGTALASIFRTRWLGELLDDGLEISHVASLTALREIPGNELDLARNKGANPRYLDGAEVEFDVLRAVAEDLLGGGEVAEITREESDNPHLRSAVGRIGGRFSIIAAPSADPARRANTFDNYAAYLGAIGESDSVLVVTSSIYMPYQFAVAIRAIGWQQPVSIEAIGFPPDWMDGVLTGPKNVLQELRSAFYGAVTLLESTG